jgi:hypothetical protein
MNNIKKIKLNFVEHVQLLLKIFHLILRHDKSQITMTE